MISGTLDILTQTVFAKARILHGVTERALDGVLSVSIPQGPVVAKSLKDGTLAVAGDLRRLFPKLATQDYSFSLSLIARSAQFISGSATLNLPILLPTGSDFDPDFAAPATPAIDLGTVRFPADPIGLVGRVTRIDATPGPVPGAAITILSAGVPAANAVTLADGRYRIAPLALSWPLTIQCAAPGFITVDRVLNIDPAQPVQQEYFFLAP